MNFSLAQIISTTLVLFSVIDIIGSIPIILDLKKKEFKVQSGKASLIALALMLIFLFLGQGLLSLFHVDIQSFAVAGSIILFLLGIEMILGVTLFKDEPDSKNGTLVPIAFPLIAGAGTMTTIISLKAEFDIINLVIGIFINIVLVYIVLKSADKIAEKMGSSGIAILRKVFGIILLAIAVKLFRENFHLIITPRQ